jgi:hypothetical protein
VKAPGMRGQWGRGGGCDFQEQHWARCFMMAKHFVPPTVFHTKSFAIMEMPPKTRPAGRSGSGENE